MSDKPISPLRQRMIDDMTARRFTEDTQRDYVRNVRMFAAFLGRSPDTATKDDLRRFQLHMARQQISPGSINAAIAALRFFFTVTLERPDLVRPLTIVNKPRRAPVVLKRQAMIVALRRGAEQHELRIGEFVGHVRPFALQRGPANPAPSLTQAPDRNDLRGWVSRGASAPSGVRIHAHFPTQSQFFRAAQPRNQTLPRRSSLPCSLRRIGCGRARRQGRRWQGLRARL